MRTVKPGLVAALLLIAASSSHAETALTLEITNIGWSTPLYTKAYASHLNTLLDRSFLFTEISPQMKKDYSLIVGRFSPPPPEQLEIGFYSNPDLQGEPLAKWGYFDMENPVTRKWEGRLCDFNVDTYVSCFYTGDARHGYFVYVTVDGDKLGTGLP